MPLAREYTVAIVTHHMRWATCESEWIGFFWSAEVVEYCPARELSTEARWKLTEDYTTGRPG